LHGEGSLLVGLRLSGVREESTLFRPAAPTEFWAAIHRASITLSVRWIVLPASTVEQPGHAEIFVLAQAEDRAEPASLADELKSLLALGFPQHRFEPIRSGEELLFALAPFGEWSWCLGLGAREDRAPSRPLGFAPLAERNGESTGTLCHLATLQADPSQALFLLARCPVATILEWTLVPGELPGASHRQFSRPEACPPPDLPSSPLAFACQVLWSGSAGRPPRLLGAGLAQAFGAREAEFHPISRRCAESCLSPILAEPAWPSRLLLAHTSLPGLLPPPASLAALDPSLRSHLRYRLPDIRLPEEGAEFGSALDGRAVRLPLADRLRHVWILGQTGTGKSTFLLNRILQDLEEGHGIAVLDPHGELAAAVRKRLPASRREDALHVDVTDRRTELPALNLLQCTDVEGAHMRAGQVADLITSLWPKDLCGPMWQQATMHALLLLAARFEEPGTLADLPKLFMDAGYRREWLEAPALQERVPHSVLWWTESYAKYTQSSRSESLDYYISKFSLFFTDPVLGSILGRSRSTMDLRQIMDQRGVLLCNLSRGGGNPAATSMLTAVFMQGLLNAALSRSDLSSDRRAPFFVYCDEFHRIAGPSTGAILSEVRKYGLGLVLAHQFIDQLPEEVLAAVLGNVGTKLMFRVGARDAHRLVAHHPSLSVSELVRLPNFAAIAELLAEGVPSAPITLRMPHPPA
jgi:hypothetical protein